MNCTVCQHPNPDNARFCMNCGNPMALACPNCGEEVPAGSKFCLNCGHPLVKPEGGHPPNADVSKAGLQEFIPEHLRAKLEDARTSGGLQGERKMVTALFSDIVDSTALAESMDPEDWREIVTGAHRLVSQAVYHYEGTIAQLLGDGVLAFFGAPLAHEDDPERAVLAALEIQRAIRDYSADLQEKGQVSDFQTRVGLNTGLVVVGNIGTDLHMEYLALGDAVNLAARVQQNAEPGTILVSSNTQKLVAPLFELQDLGELEVKGKSEPVRVYQIIRPKARPGSLRGIQGLDAPLIEREHEMGVLRDAVASLQAGRGQILSVMGEAGLGKSRLLTELRKSLAADGLIGPASSDANGNGPPAPARALRWHEGRSLSYETTTPFAPFIDLVADCFGLRPEWTEPERYDHIKSEIAGLMPEGGPEAAAHISSMLGIQLPKDDLEMLRFLDPQALRQRVFGSTLGCFELLAQMQPMVLVFDDLHWIDPTSLDLLEQLLSLTERTPLMIAALFRPRKQEPAWRFHEKAERDFSHRYTPLDLRPLDENGSRLLVSSLLHVEDLPEKVRALIMEKAEGNPFFVEEIIRSLLDARLVVRENSHWKATREIEQISVPDTLVGVITARLDQLNDEAKLAVQAAAVIGRQFEFETLKAIYADPGSLEEALAELERRELVREKARTPKRVYQFKHALTQETAYDSLLRRQCQQLHLRVAEYFERIQADRPAEIARHFLEARHEARALPYLINAGEHAARSSSTTEAADFFSQALKILENVKDIEMARRAREGLGASLMLSGDLPRAVQTYKTMLDYAIEENDRAMQVSALNKLALITGGMQEKFDEAQALLAEAERVAETNDDTAGMAELHVVKCNVCVVSGDLEGAIDHMQRSAMLGTDRSLEEPLLLGLTHAANALTLLAHLDQAWDKAEEALRLADQFGNRRWRAEILAGPVADHYLFAGEIEAGRLAAEEGMSIAAAIGAHHIIWDAAYRLGEIARMQGYYERALTYLSQGYAIGQASGSGILQLLPLSSLSLAHLSLGRSYTDRLQEDMTTIALLAETPSGSAWGAAAHRALGYCHLVMGELDKSAAEFDAGLTVPTAFLHLGKPELLVGCAGVATEQGRLPQAADLLAEARSYAEEVGLRHIMPLVDLAEARIRLAEADYHAALKSYELAQEGALEMGLRPIVLQARCGAAASLDGLGRQDQASAKRGEAQAMLDEIAGLFQDEDLRNVYKQSNSRLLHSPGPATW